MNRDRPVTAEDIRQMQQEIATLTMEKAMLTYQLALAQDEFQEILNRSPDGLILDIMQNELNMP